MLYLSACTGYDLAGVEERQFTADEIDVFAVWCETKQISSLR